AVRVLKPEDYFFFAVAFFAGAAFFAVVFLAGAVFFAVVFLTADVAAVFFAAPFFAGAAFDAVFFAVVFLAAGAAFLGGAWSLAAASARATMLSTPDGRSGTCFGSRPSLISTLAICFNRVPALNFGADRFLTRTASPVCGLRPMRPGRETFSNDPKPVMVTFSPLATLRSMMSRTPSTAALATFLSPNRSASRSINSDLFTVPPA